ncbi:MAG: short-chain dehydrogenase [Gemmatimonadetes bacterium]|nr:short-chain dehydrogenase [Gemmatimonadota bacterium]
MDIQGRNVLILGGSGLVGMAVARELMPHVPALLVISGLTRAEAEEAVTELEGDPAKSADTRIEAAWGDIFHRDETRERARSDVLADTAARRVLLDDLYGELTDDVVAQSALGALIARTQPAIVVDCINTATAFAYQNVFDSAMKLRALSEAGSVPNDVIEGHLATLYLPQLIRHVQIALEAMRRANTGFYLKVGTAGTGGMGLNIPFTHSEERPSRMLLAKSGVAGAHTLLLYLMARTPGAPAVKEIKPTAAISWKRIAFGEVRRRGRAIERIDATTPVPVAAAFDSEPQFRQLGTPLTGVFLDAGENGLFSMGEFETLTALGLMEFVTPEEIATNVVREIRGYPTGKDVVAALDGATSGPTYRAGVLREVALDRMAALERENGVEAVAYEMLGPPRLSKLLFESAILARLYTGLENVAGIDPDAAAAAAHDLISSDDDLRSRILTIGLPILLPDGATMLRGPDVKIAPEDGQSVADPRLAEAGWVDLRAANWRKWSERAQHMLHERGDGSGPEHGSRADTEPGDRGVSVRPGRMAAWVFRYEDRGERGKR